MTMNMNNRNNRAIIFKDQEHEMFYMNCLPKCRRQDVYHKALIYCLGISGDTRQNVERIYDFNRDSVKTECLGEGWITSGSARVVRIAFNLFCNGTPSAYGLEGEEKVRECQRYTVEDLFCCEYAVYFLEAVKVRYPEYCLRCLEMQMSGAKSRVLRNRKKDGSANIWNCQTGFRRMTPSVS